MRSSFISVYIFISPRLYSCRSASDLCCCYDCCCCSLAHGWLATSSPSPNAAVAPLTPHSDGHVLPARSSAFVVIRRRSAPLHPRSTTTTTTATILPNCNVNLKLTFFCCSELAPANSRSPHSLRLFDFVARSQQTRKVCYKKSSSSVLFFQLALVPHSPTVLAPKRCQWL